MYYRPYYRIHVSSKQTAPVIQLPLSVATLDNLNAWEIHRFYSHFHHKHTRKLYRSTYAAMLLESGQRSIEAWYFMFSICFFNASLSMVAIVLASIGCGGDSRRRRSEFYYWLEDGDRIDLEFEKAARQDVGAVLRQRPDNGARCSVVYWLFGLHEN